MDIDKKLNLLKKIQPVEAPPFMLTRIMDRINSNSVEQISTSWKISFVVAGITILALNTAIVLKSVGSQEDFRLKDAVSAMELSTSNQLYND